MIDNRVAGLTATLGGSAAALASWLTWIRIEIDGVSGPGSIDTGLDGRDGRTVLLVGVASVLVGVALLVGRGEGWLKAALLVAGGITTIIAAVGIADASAKAGTLEERFGIGPAIVTAEVGPGLWLVGVAGLALLAAGLAARRAL